MNQTYLYLEVILVLHKTNGGLVTARKAALATAKGDYIGFVNEMNLISNNQLT